jgi:Carboxypeptidase regulatory-like domain
MRTSWRGVVVLGSLGVLPWWDARAFANGHYGRGQAYPTGYVVAAEYVTAVPTTYVVPSASFVPTVYARSYTAFELVPTVYRPRPTAYVRPAAYFYPIAWVSPAWVATSSSECCDPCATTAAASVSVGNGDGGRSRSFSTPPAPTKSGKAAGESSAVKPPASLDSGPPRIGSGGVPETTAKREPVSPPPAAAASAAGPVDSSVPTPPSAPVPERDLGTPITPVPPEKKPADLGAAPEAKPLPQAGNPGTDPSKAKPPVAPGGDPPPVELPPPAGEEAVRREVQRPLIRSRTTQPYVRSAKKGDLNVLEGRVVADAGSPEAGVLVTVENALGTFTDRVATTDALGHYAVRLPDGDWTVKVTMPSGRSYAVSRLTVSGGQISDDLGRDVPSLTITR